MRLPVLIFFILTLLTIEVVGQNHVVGFKKGVNLAKVTTQYANTRHALYYTTGFIYEYRNTKNKVLGIE